MGNVGNSMSSDAMGPYASFTPIAIALVITLVLLIVYYKFNSHNRYAGYCKLLNEESWNIPSELNEDVYTWEICIDRLRHFDTHKHELISLCEGATIEVEGNVDDAKKRQIKDKFSSEIQDISGLDPKIDNNKKRNGFRLFRRSIRGEHDSSSWGFPIRVTLVFFLTSTVNILWNCWIYLADIITFSQCQQGRIRSNYCANNISYSQHRYIFSVVVSLVVFIWKTPHAYEWQLHSSQFLSEVYPNSKQLLVSISTNYSTI